MTSPSSRRGTIDLNIRNMSFSQKSDIDIFLRGSDGPFGSYIQTFSTLDKIEGVVRITPRVNTHFEDMEIAMLGMKSKRLCSFMHVCHPRVGAHVPTSHALLHQFEIMFGPETMLTEAQESRGLMWTSLPRLQP